jgi:hypothetical protein
VKALSAGSEIDAWCTRCRLDLNHRIVAMVAGRAKRVVCLTCGSQHNYRAPKSAAAVRDVRVQRPASAAKKPPKSRGVDPFETWNQRVAGKSADAFTSYGMERTYREGELVAHPRFGSGFVADVREDGKVTIVFREGPRTLACGRPS